MTRITDPSFKFWYDEKWYTVQGAETMVRIGTKDDMSTMTSEYTRMRDAAQKRIARLQKAFPDAKAGQHKYDTGKVDKEGNPIYKSGFPTLKTLDPRDFPKAFAELAKFLNAKTSTVTGQRSAQAKTTATLNKAIGATDDDEDEEGDGGPKVTKQNYWRVIKILEEARRRKVTYDSSKIVSLAETTLSFTKDQFDSVLDNLDKMVEHSDEVQGSLDEYMKKRKIQSYQRVDVDDFIDQLGW